MTFVFGRAADVPQSTWEIKEIKLKPRKTENKYLWDFPS